MGEGLETSIIVEVVAIMVVTKVEVGTFKALLHSLLLISWTVKNKKVISVKDLNVLINILEQNRCRNQNQTWTNPKAY